MILSEYEAKRMELDRKMEDLNERQAEHMMQLASRFQLENKKIGMQMGNLKKKRQELLQKYKQDKQYVHQLYKKEKQEVCARMHSLRLEYLTVNNIDCKETRQAQRDT